MNIRNFLKSNNINSDKDLYKWMRENIKYSNFDNLKSPEEVIQTKCGSCHDQVNLEFECLTILGYHPHILFFIAYNPNSNIGGQTHSLCYYKKGNNSIYWIENSWGGNKGIREYKNIYELKQDCIHRYNIIKKDDFPELYFKSVDITKFKKGINLKKFVDSIMM